MDKLPDLKKNARFKKTKTKTHPSWESRMLPSPPSLPPSLALHHLWESWREDSPRIKREINVLGRRPSWGALGNVVHLIINLTAWGLSSLFYFISFLLSFIFWLLYPPSPPTGLPLFPWWVIGSSRTVSPNCFSLRGAHLWPSPGCPLSMFHPLLDL